MDVGVTEESEIRDKDHKGNSNKSEIMDIENVNDADNGASALDTTEIADNAANSEIVHSADRHLSTSVVIEDSVPEKSAKSVIVDNGAPDKSDIVDGAYSSPLDTEK